MTKEEMVELTYLLILASLKQSDQKEIDPLNNDVARKEENEQSKI